MTQPVGITPDEVLGKMADRLANLTVELAMREASSDRLAAESRERQERIDQLETWIVAYHGSLPDENGNLPDVDSDKPSPRLSAHASD